MTRAFLNISRMFKLLTAFLFLLTASLSAWAEEPIPPPPSPGDISEEMPASPEPPEWDDLSLETPSSPPPPPKALEAGSSDAEIPPPPSSETAQPEEQAPPPPPEPPKAAEPKEQAPPPAPKTQPEEKRPAASRPAASTASAPSPLPLAPTDAQLANAYNYAYKLYAAKRFEEAFDVFKKVALISDNPTLNANSLYYYSQCAFRLENYTECVKAINILARKYPRAEAIQKGYVPRFCVFLINEATKLQTQWDYMRFKERQDENGDPVWKESVPPGLKIKRINFKLAFGLYRALETMLPNDPQTAAAKRKLDAMLNTPITVLWVDEKAPPTKWGHPGDFLSLFSLNEKKDFSKVICKRMFYDWETEKFHQFLEMHDEIRNLKPRFVARTKPPPADPAALQETTAQFTLARLFRVAGYDPFQDDYTNLIETSPADLAL